jgi:hypothetical protein
VLLVVGDPSLGAEPGGSAFTGFGLEELVDHWRRGPDWVGIEAIDDRRLGGASRLYGRGGCGGKRRYRLDGHFLALEQQENAKECCHEPNPGEVSGV